MIFEIKQRHAGSVIGVGWAILYPVMLLTIYSVVYIFIFKIRPPTLSETEYVVLVFSGLVPLLSLNESLLSASSSLLSNKNLLLNTVFPAELIPIRAILAAQFSGIVGLTITLISAFILGRITWQTIITVFVFWLLLVIMTIGLSLILSLITLAVRDMTQLLGLVLMILMIISPFAYTPDMVPARLSFLLYLNPFTYFVLGFQSAIVYGTWPSARIIVVATSLSTFTIVLGTWFFYRTKHIFLDYA